MSAGAREYAEVVARLGREASTYLRDMENTMENFHLRLLPQLQEQVGAKFLRSLAQNREEIAALEPPPQRQDFHQQLVEGYTHLSQSCQVFCRPVPTEHWLLCLRGCRMEMCQAMRLLYPLRRQIPGLDTYWITEDELPNLDRIETPPHPPAGAPVGLLYRDWDPEPPRYTLYVPENYHPGRQWPLIVQLHGGGGNDHDSVWLWLRHAKSKGYLLVAPKSTDFTWTFSDIKVVLAAIKEVASMYQVNPKGVFITGVSDGGTFSYEFGLTNPHVFAAIAPVAGAFVPWPWYDFTQSNHIPLFILHGTQDRVIPVAFARQARDILGDHGYKIIYQELPHWGHAWPYSKIGEICAFFGEVLQRREAESA